MFKRFDAKDRLETRVLTFDFTLDLAPTELLIDPPIVSIEVQTGYDTEPESIIAGEGALDIGGLLFRLPVHGGNPDTEYAIKVWFATTNPNKSSALTGILPVF